MQAGSELNERLGRSNLITVFYLYLLLFYLLDMLGVLDKKCFERPISQNHRLLRRSSGQDVVDRRGLQTCHLYQVD